MKQLGTTLLFCVVCIAQWPTLVLAQDSSVQVNWQAELEKAKAGIEKNPNSAFWHNQAGVAFDGLGDFKSAVRELKLASTLDPTHDQRLCAVCSLQKKGN